MEQILKLLMQSQMQEQMRNQQSGEQSLAQMLPYLSYTKKMNNFMAPSREIAGAMSDMSSPKYQNIYGQFKQQGQQNLSESIAEMMRQNRKQSMLGRAALFSPERGGETMFRGLTKGYQDVQNDASRQTFDQLKSAYTMQSQQDGMRQQNALQKANLFGTGASAIAKLIGL